MPPSPPMVPRSILALALLFVATPAIAKARFEKEELSVPGYIVSLDWADLDADGWTDLVVAYRRGLGPEAARFLAIFFRGPNGYGQRPDLMIAAPPGAAVWDLGDALPTPGEELVYLTSFGAIAQSLAGRKASNPITIARARTMVGEPEEEDLVRWDFLRALAPNQPEVLLLPTQGALEIFRRDPDPDPKGTTFKRWQKIDVQKQSFYDAESLTYKQGRRGGAGGRPFSLRVTTILPTLTFLDQTGDGIVDLIANYEDRVAVYPGHEDGTISSTAAYHRWLQFLTPAEQASHDTEMSIEPLDIDGDGIADLSATKIGGGITNLHSETRIYFGQKGGGFSQQPSQAFKDDGFAIIVRYVDLDGDGKLEMVHPYVPVSLLAMSQVFITGKFTLELRMRRRNGRLFEEKPAQTLDTVFAIDFSTGGGLRGMVPIYGHDFDGDGKKDILISQGAEKIELHRGIAGNREIFDDDESLVLSGPISRETYAVPQRATGASEVDLVAAYVDQPKLVGRLMVWIQKKE